MDRSCIIETEHGDEIVRGHGTEGEAIMIARNIADRRGIIVYVSRQAADGTPPITVHPAMVRS